MNATTEKLIAVARHRRQHVLYGRYPQRGVQNPNRQSMARLIRRERKRLGRKGLLRRMTHNGRPLVEPCPLPFAFDDGGRKAAGFRGDASDCVTRAIAVATERPYAEVYAALNALAQGERKTKRRRRKSSARTGVYKPTYRRYLESLGWQWVPTMRIGHGCKVHLRQGELPDGRLIVSVSRHLVAVIDGTVHDTHDPTRDGSRCVYGYWRTP